MPMSIRVMPRFRLLLLASCSSVKKLQCVTLVKTRATKIGANILFTWKIEQNVLRYKIKLKKISLFVPPNEDGRKNINFMVINLLLAAAERGIAGTDAAAAVAVAPLVALIISLEMSIVDTSMQAVGMKTMRMEQAIKM